MLRHFDVEQAFVQATVEEEIYTDVPEEYEDSPGADGRLNKPIYGWRMPPICLNQKIPSVLKTQRYY